jgi:hypothetical protein
VYTGHIVGYDPGGDGTHGVAVLTVERDAAVSVETFTLSTAEDVITCIGALSDLWALGIDTLTCWSTGRCGWRPADRWLRATYPMAVKSVVSPNGLYGSMGLNGMAVLNVIRLQHPSAQVTETHPKVLYCHLAGHKYNWTDNSDEMTKCLEGWLSCPVKPTNDHEWDAVLSAHAALEGLTGRWRTDLHRLPVSPSERLVEPAGKTHYYWPSQRAV